MPVGDCNYEKEEKKEKGEKRKGGKKKRKRSKESGRGRLGRRRTVLLSSLLARCCACDSSPPSSSRPVFFLFSPPLLSLSLSLLPRLYVSLRVCPHLLPRRPSSTTHPISCERTPPSKSPLHLAASLLIPLPIFTITVCIGISILRRIRFCRSNQKNGEERTASYRKSASTGGWISLASSSSSPVSPAYHFFLHPLFPPLLRFVSRLTFFRYP